MLKNYALKKIIIISLSLLFLLIIYFFPKEDEYNITSTVTYEKIETIPIYLLDNSNYVSRIEVIKKEKDTNLLIDEIIDNLKIDNKNYHIPSSFKKIIPKNTKIISKELKDGLLKINFSKELLDIPEYLEEKLIESIVYSLTEIKDVNRIMIFVDGIHLTNLPSGRKIPEILDRKIGINKEYDIKSMKNLEKITTYYISKIDDIYYYTPVTTIQNKDKEKIEVIIEKLKYSPTFETNLVTYLSSASKLLNYEILENSVNLSFNNELLSMDTNSIIEEVKYSIALSIKDTYDINETIFFIDNRLIDVAFI